LGILLDCTTKDYFLHGKNAWNGRNPQSALNQRNVQSVAAGSIITQARAAQVPDETFF